MKNTTTFKLKGYTIQGIDVRDGSTFEDFTVRNVLDSNGERKGGGDLRAEIIREYARYGYEVSQNGIIEDIEHGGNHRANKTDNDTYTVEIDLIQEYIKARENKS